MTSIDRRLTTATYWFVGVAGVVLLAAGAYTGYTEGVRADEGLPTSGILPAEIAGFVFGPLLVVAAIVLAISTRRARLSPTPDLVGATGTN